MIVIEKHGEQADPGYTINEEFNNISHDRGIVSMARTADPNSAGSQFFIVLKIQHFWIINTQCLEK